MIDAVRYFNGDEGRPEKIFELTVRFNVSGSELKMHEGTHLECLQYVQTLMTFIREEHEINKTHMIFKENFRDADNCTVTATNVNKYNNTRLWMILKIREKVA